jgi:multidrug resistance efflux pump
MTAGCDSKKKVSGKGKKAARVKAVRAEKTRIVEKLKVTGEVVAIDTAVLQSTVEGPIEFCPWREGDRIDRAGEKLVVIERPLYREEARIAEGKLAVAKAELADLLFWARPEEIAQAKASVRHFEDCTDFAKADYERIRSLVESGSLPGEEAEKARVAYTKCHTQLEAAREELAMLEAGPTETEIGVAKAKVQEMTASYAFAKAKLDECVIKAPFPGIITEVYVRPGDLATPRQKLLKIMDPSSLVVRAGLPENSSDHIRRGDELTVRFDVYPEKSFHARIERVYPRIERNSRTRIIEAKVTDSVKLIPRMFARLSVQGRVAEDAVVIPDIAIVATPRGHKVVYIAEDGKAKRQVIRIGLQSGNYVQVIEGVQAGQMVITEGNLKLKDGASIQFGKQDSTSANTQKSGKDKT